MVTLRIRAQVLAARLSVKTITESSRSGERGTKIKQKQYIREGLIKVSEAISRINYGA